MRAKAYILVTMCILVVLLQSIGVVLFRANLGFAAGLVMAPVNVLAIFGADRFADWLIGE